jgi:HK97 family phage major capsid protein
MLSAINEKRAVVKKEAAKAWADFDAFRQEHGDKAATDKDLFEKTTELHHAYEEKRQEYESLTERAREAAIMEGAKAPEQDRPGPGEGEKERKVEGELEPISKTAGERFAESKAMAELRSSGLLDMEHSKFSTPRVEALSRGELKTLLTGGGAPGTSFLRNDRLPGFMPLMLAPIDGVVQLVSKGDTDSNVVEWVRQTGFTNNAAETAEATATAGSSGTKPESALAFTVESTTVRTIAHWIPATRQALSDMGQLRTIVDAQLQEGVRRRLNNQVLNGDGSAPNLRGILNTSGVGTDAAANTSDVLEALFRAITALRVAFFEADAILMNPADWGLIRLVRDASGASAATGQYMFGPPSQVGADQIWGKRVVLDPTIASGHALVGDFSQAILYTREGIQVLATDSHSDFFIRNIVVVLAEGRWAFAVPRPTAFVNVDIVP